MIKEIENPKVSIIVPVYNTEKYLERCLDSLVEQDFEENFEIITVDDAATDKSFEILKSYAKKNQNIKIIRHKKNLGLPSSRKTGLENSKGDYIFFVDSDDWIEKNTLSLMYKKAENGNKDVVYANFDRIDPAGNIEWTTNINAKYFEMENITEEIRIKQFIYDPVNFWGKLYRRKWFVNTGICFMDGGSFDEDNIEILFTIFTNNTGLITDVLYHYFDAPHSMSNASGIHLKERYNAAKYVLSEAKRLNIYKNYKELLDFAFYRSFFLGTIGAIIESKNFYCSELDILGEYAKKYKFDFLNNKYILNQSSENNLLLLKSLSSKEKFIQAYFSEFATEYEKNKIEELTQNIKKNHRRIILWSAGKRTRTLLYKFPKLADQISYVVDRNAKLDGTILEGNIKVRSIENMDNDIDLIIVPKSDWIKDIKKYISCNVQIIDLIKYMTLGE